MSQLSEEIGRLFALHQQGVLSQEEFAEAKKAVIQSFTAQAAAVPSRPTGSEREARDCDDRARQEQVPAVAVPGPTARSEGPGIASQSPGGDLDTRLYEAGIGAMGAGFSRVNVSDFDEFDHSLGARETALAHLETLIRNIMQNPTDAKFRRLRVENPRLQRELFNVRGTTSFLLSLNFALVPTSDPAAPSGAQELQMASPPDMSLLEEGLQAVRHLQRHDRESLQGRMEYAHLRRSISVEVRWERWQQVKRTGDVLPYLTAEFCRDDAGDGLFTVTENIAVLEKILSNVRGSLEGGDAARLRYRRVRLGSRVALNAIIQQRGGLELVVGVGGAQLQECPGGQSAALLVFEPTAAVPLPPSHPEKRERDGLRDLILGDTVASDEELMPRVAQALDFLARIAEAVLATRQEIRVREREAAVAAARLELAKSRKTLGVATGRHETPSDTETAAQGSGRRIPMTQALRFLLGRTDDSLL